MTETPKITIRAEAVAAAARKLPMMTLHSQTREALEAAAPLIVAAELERLAWWIESQPVELADMTPAGKQYRSGKEFVSGALRRRAAGLRGVSGVSADGGEGEKR